jgi:hypothetical protein
MALCSQYGPLSLVRPFVPSEKQRKQPSCFAKCFAKRVSSKLQGLSRSISYKW